MAGFTYHTRRKITEQWVNDTAEKGKYLSSIEKNMLPGTAYYAVPQDACRWMQRLLDSGKYKKLSEIYKYELSGLVEVCVSAELRDGFYYGLDEMNQFQLTAGWYRRSVRSKSYQAFVSRSILLLWAYSKLGFYGASMAEILTGKADPEIYDHARTESWNYAGIVASQIDLKDEELIQSVRDVLLGEGNTMMISRELILGIVMSRDESLYDLLGKFLLAARLQEGVRQAVCETMDAGRPEAFLHLFKVIEENGLIRYSSVKRAVSTWIGIFDEKNVDRITEKLVRLMGQCLRDEDFCREQIASNDSIAISCGLWAKGFYDAEIAIKEELELIRHGTKNQKMTASYFNHSLQMEDLKMQAAKEAVMRWPEDLELVACFLPDFIGKTQQRLSELTAEKQGRGINPTGSAALRKPDLLHVDGLFQDFSEARTAYLLLRDIFNKIPKKGIELNPCIFPWHKVELSRSDVAVRMCLIAWMLQEEEYLDEAAGLIPLIGQGDVYGTAARAAAARVLLYRPNSQVRRDILFELLHNPEEYTSRAAYLLVDDMELSIEDYLKIEQNLKYKKGRERILALLKRQDQEELRACIGRLLQTASEECHMGALDLALQMKKENPKEFIKVLPLLADVKDPTGKEQILLKELTGENSDAQDILNMPGYGFYDPQKEWILPPVDVDMKKAARLFVNGEDTCIRILKKLSGLVEDNKDREYRSAWSEDIILGDRLERSRWIHGDQDLEPLDAFPFRELWEKFYSEEIKTPEMMMELYFYQKCRADWSSYEKNLGLYKKVFGSGLLKKPPFKNLVQGLSYEQQVRTVTDTLFLQYVPDAEKVRWGLLGTARLLSVLDHTNCFIEVSEKTWTGGINTYTKRVTELPVIEELWWWLSLADHEDWGNAFTLRFRLQEFYETLRDKERNRGYNRRMSYLGLADFVQCYVRGLWDKNLFYRAVFTFLTPGELLKPVSTVEQKGAVLSRNAGIYDLNSFFGIDTIRPVDGKYHFDQIGEELPAMGLAHEICREMVPAILTVELKRGEQETPFSQYIRSIRVVYGIEWMIRILTALGQDSLKRSGGYRSETDRRSVLSHLLKICHPGPEETVKDLKEALKGTEISKKRLVELAMYAQQWIPILEKYFELPGFQSGCYYFMAHTSELLDEFMTSMVAKYSPLSPEELRDGAFDLRWFFEAYEKLGEKNFKLLYDAAKYSSNGAAHARARKYADAALGRTEKNVLKKEINEKRNKDLLMSFGLLPLEEERQKREEDLLDRYQFIQEFKKESRQFGAQRRASEGRAAELALQNLSVNAGFTDVTRLTLRMENRLLEEIWDCFEWKTLGDMEFKIQVDETGKSTLQYRKNGKILKSIPAKHKKDENVLKYQSIVKKLKEQYSRTRQMMEQAMEDRTEFEVWELLELKKNPVIRPVTEPLVMKLVTGESAADVPVLGFLTEEGVVDWSGKTVPAALDDRVLIAHPHDLYREGHWHEYQKILFEKQVRQAFKQVFRELYVKLPEELEKSESMMFSGNQIQPQKTAGALKSRRWVADYEDGLQKIYYRENIVARIYAMADWFSPGDVEAPTLEWVAFSDRKTFKPLKIEAIPDVIYSEVMRDVDLAVSVAHAGGVDPETSHSTIEMRRALVECSLELFKINNVKLEGSHAIIDGKLGRYTVHLGSGIVHQMGNAMLFVIPVHSQHRGRLFLPFLDDDPKTAEIVSKILLFAEDTKIKDPSILSQIR